MGNNNGLLDEVRRLTEMIELAYQRIEVLKDRAIESRKIAEEEIRKINAVEIPICPVCNQEMFQSFTRTISIETGICKRCAAQWDINHEDETRERALQAVERGERIALAKELGREWARSFDGKPCTLFYLENCNDLFWDTNAKSYVNGHARIARKPNGQEYVWGKVLFVVAEEEKHRISEITIQRWRWVGGSAGDGYELDEPHGILDGREWGPLFQKIGDEYTYLLNYSSRAALVKRVV